MHTHTCIRTSQISVHIPGSNYTNTFLPPKQSLAIPFEQLPTITTTPPDSVIVPVDVSFTYDFISTSNLGLPLSYGPVTTLPPELSTDIVMTMRGSRNQVEMTGTISSNRVLPIILEQAVVPTISIPVIDSIEGTVIATTELHIQQSPPIFDQSHYEFNTLEESGNGVEFGPISILDPNGDLVDAPVILSPLESQLFRVIPVRSTSPVYTTFSLLSVSKFDYELTTMYEFELVARDRVNTTLYSQASVQVNVLPRNEFPPTFQEPRSVFEAYLHGCISALFKITTSYAYI